MMGASLQLARSSKITLHIRSRRILSPRGNFSFKQSFTALGNPCQSENIEVNADSQQGEVTGQLPTLEIFLNILKAPKTF